MAGVFLLPSGISNITMGTYYILDRKKITSTNDLIQWAKWFEKSAFKRTIRKTHVKGMMVSTVFLSLDHNHARRGKPILFETMVFNVEGGNASDLQMRASCLDAAKLIHRDVVKILRKQKVKNKTSRIIKTANERVYYTTRHERFRIRRTGLSNTIYHPRKKRHTGFRIN